MNHTLMPHSLFAFCLVLLIGCSNKSTTESAHQTEALTDTTRADLTKEYYTILRRMPAGTFQNLDILIDSSYTSPVDIEAVARMVHSKECGSTPCNIITFWDSQRAVDLWYKRSDAPAWRKQNWTYLCEHDVAEFNTILGELALYPFLNSEYHRLGGKKERSKPSIINLESKTM